MMNPKSLFQSLTAAACLLSALPTFAAETVVTESDDLRSELELLRSDFNGAKVQAINAAMKLTGPEAGKFWPIYRAYEGELAQVGDRKLALIQEFLKSQSQGTLDNPTASRMAKAWLKNVRDRLDLWEKYHKKISKELSPIRGAQFLQVEHQMALFIDLNIAAEMPTIAPGTAGAEATKAVAGGYSPVAVTDENVVAAARAAVNLQALTIRTSSNQPTALELIEITHAEQQVVSGTNYRLDLKVKSNGKEKTAQALVWWQGWRKPDPYQLTQWTWK